MSNRIATCPNCGNQEFIHYYVHKHTLEVSEILRWEEDADMPEYGKTWEEEEGGSGAFHYKCDECGNIFESPKWIEEAK